MPPTKTKPAKPILSSSRDLVPVGPREVFAKNASRRDENGNKPLTARALVLRNGKYGARGSGEIVLAGKMSGREKLDLLAEDLVERSKKALGTPFRLEKCLNIADSQLAANLDEISDLQDRELFYAKIIAEINARKSQTSAPDPLRNPSYVASIVASRIHNAYMMASAWRLIGDTLRVLAEAGVQDGSIKNSLKKDAGLRAQFLVLYDIVNVVAQAGQAKFALLATTAPHYSQYFKKVDDSETGEEEYVFDWALLKDVHKSFIDSIIVELCLPQSAIPRQILYQILHEAIDESPRDAKRFPQAVWDAVGDLSVIVQLQEYLESPLLGPDGEAWKKLPREMPEEYENWVDAQIFSEKASKMYANFKDVIHPLEKTKTANVLENMWKFVNLNYKDACGKDIDTLWQLNDVKQLTPQWHAFYVPVNHDDDDDDDMPHLLPVKSKGKGGKGKPGNVLAITNGTADDSDGSMPSLQTVSDSSEEDDDTDDDDSDYEDEDEDDSDPESGYDTDEEDALRDMLREAMDTAMATPDFFDPKIAAPEFDELAEERKGNPFLKLLGSLRGRMFSSNPTLKTTTRTEPRRPFGSRKPTTAPPQQAPKPATHPSAKPSPVPTPAVPKSHKATVEAVEDEDEVAATAAKKKKKKPKKKKKQSSQAAPDQQQAPDTPVVPTSSPAAQAPSTPKTPSSPLSNGAPAVTASPPPKKTANPKSPQKHARPASISSSTTTHPHMSTTSLPIPQTAQSAHKYLQTEGLATKTKEKVKSRPDYGNLEAISEKKGFLSRFSRKDKTADDEPVKKGGKFSYFSRLSKKTSTYMHQLLRTKEDDKQGLAPMKWEHFLKVMREMGFTYEPSTAGSSVRFDPPDPRDTPITFHKPHPDPTLQPVMLRDFRKRLQKHYGWSEEDFYKATQ